MRTMTSKEMRDALWPLDLGKERACWMCGEPVQAPYRRCVPCEAASLNEAFAPPFELDERVCCAATGHVGTVVHMMPPTGGNWIIVVRLDGERRTSHFAAQMLERAPELSHGLEDILSALATAGLDGAQEHLAAERAAQRARSVVTEAREQIAKLPRQQRRRLQRKAKR